MSKKLKKTKGVKESMDASIPERTLPSLRISEIDLPSVKNRKVDETFNIVCKVKVTELSRERWTKEKKLNMSCDIIAISLEKQEYEDEYADRMKD